jgi:hypothetical protein
VTPGELVVSWRKSAEHARTVAQQAGIRGAPAEREADVYQECAYLLEKSLQELQKVVEGIIDEG